MLATAILAALALADGPAGPGTTGRAFIEPLPPPAASAHLGVQRALTVQGPFAVPGTTPNDTSDDNGMGQFQELVALPCRDCYITGFSFDLAYADGTYANTNTGMYLHHAVLLNLNRADATCPPELAGSAPPIQRMFAAGNERGAIDMTLNGTRKAGYYVAPNDTVALLAEVMNAGPAPRPVVVKITWDYAAANATASGSGSGFAPVVPVWLDIDGSCGTFTNASEVAVPGGAAAFSYTAPAPWRPAPAAADNQTTAAAAHYDVLVAASHLHDGGLQLDIVKNGAVVCEGRAAYGETPGFVSRADGVSTGSSPRSAASELTHISSIHQCAGVGTTSSGDAWSVTAHYNLTAHPGMMTTDGGVKPIMGIGMLFLAQR